MSGRVDRRNSLIDERASLELWILKGNPSKYSTTASRLETFRLERNDSSVKVEEEVRSSLK